jgi:DNA invertase Pin-like site-specific DNA recombinase
MVVVRTYVDAAKSGLTLNERPGLRELLEDVEKGSPGYSAVLVYDVSRWGRFQDADESAYYEYRCRRAKIEVHYCAEPFANDSGIVSALLKTLKRAMAAEYSRELSVKVFAGKARLIELGFRQGGLAGYGLRRLLVDRVGKPKQVLHSGEAKSIATDRVVLIPGPAEEVAIVNEIFRMYALERRSPDAIARVLNERGVSWVDGRPWTRYVIREMVNNPKYIGTNVSSRRTGQLRSRRTNNPPVMWIKREQAFPAIVDHKLYAEAQRVSALRAQYSSEEELLNYLREFLREHGTMSARKINADPDMPCPQAYVQRFGSLMAAYRKIGYEPSRNVAHIERDRGLHAIRRSFTNEVVGALNKVGLPAKKNNHTGLIEIAGNSSVRAIVARCRSRGESQAWIFRLRSGRSPDQTVVGRLAPGNRNFLDYFCIARADIGGSTQFTVRVETGCPAGWHRFTSLPALLDELRRSK